MRPTCCRRAPSAPSRPISSSRWSISAWRSACGGSSSSAAQRLFRAAACMIEFTFWDIVRNLLLAARWTILLSIVAFIGGAVVGMAILLLRISKRKWAAALRRSYIGAVPGHAAADAAVPDVLRPADARLPHRAVDGGRARPDPLRQRLSRRDLARRRRGAAARPVGRRRQPRAALSPGAQADHPAAGLRASRGRRWSASWCS